MVRETLDYRTPKGSVELVVDVPYVDCPACGFSGFGEAGERARTEAIYRYHDRTTPWDIVEIRERLDMSQREFADYIGVGHASVERWEMGETMQNQSMDNLILLLAKPGIKDQLDSMKQARSLLYRKTDVVTDLGRFRALTETEFASAHKKAERFRLRR